MDTKGMYLRDAQAAAREIERQQNEMFACVSGARRAGASWSEIGAAVGMSKQSAHERWGKLTPAPQTAASPSPDA